MRGARRLVVALLLVSAGRLLSPDAVPVYDGLGQPDEPYRFVVPPVGAPRTAPPTTAKASSPLRNGTSQYGMPATTAENGPQFSLFLPPQAIATTGATVQVKVAPKAPTDQPGGARIDGNVYEVDIVGGGPVTLTSKAALATLYLRATTARQPGPTMEYRPAEGQPWKALRTVRAGQDVYVSSFPGPGLFALAFSTSARAKGGGTSPLPFIALGGVVLLVVVVVVVRLRARS